MVLPYLGALGLRLSLPSLNYLAIVAKNAFFNGVFAVTGARIASEVLEGALPTEEANIRTARSFYVTGVWDEARFREELRLRNLKLDVIDAAVKEAKLLKAQKEARVIYSTQEAAYKKVEHITQELTDTAFTSLAKETRALHDDADHVRAALEENYLDELRVWAKYEVDVRDDLRAYLEKQAGQPAVGGAAYA